MARSGFSTGRDASQRQLRVGELIRRTLAGVLARGDIHDPELDAMSITVGEVRSSPDLKLATAYVMPLGGHEPEAALAALRRHRHKLRRIVGKAVALKFTPEIRFALDMTFDQMDATRRMFCDPTVQRDIAAGEDD